MSDFIIIPAFNEEKTIAKVLRDVQKYSNNIIVVDDGSKDSTAQIAFDHGATVLHHVVNLGKGAALKTGCDFAMKQGAKRLIVMDADGQHEAKEIPHFLQALNKSEIVFSYRKQSQSMPFVLKVGNRVISDLLKLLFNIRVYDSQCGFRAFTKSAYPKIRWKTTDYYMETEMIIRAGRKNVKSTQLPIKTIYGDKYKGTTVMDGILIVAKMFAWRVFK